MATKKLPNERPEQPKLVLDNKLIVQINQELGLIRAVLQRSLKDEQQKPQPLKKPKIAQRVSEKLKQLAERFKPTFGTKEDEETTGVKKVDSDLVSKVPTLAALGIGTALVFSQPFRDLVWGALKNVFDLGKGILPEPLQDFIKLFTKDKATEKIAEAIEEFNKAGELGEESKKEFDTTELESRSDEIEAAANKAKIATEKEKKEQGPAPSPVPVPTPVVAKPAPPAPASAPVPAPVLARPATSRPTPSASQPIAGQTPSVPLSGVQGVIVNSLMQTGITSPRAHANILATVKAESNFQPRSEDLNYTSASHIQNTFGRRRFPDLEFAERFVRNPVELGNEAYKTTDGNSEPGDGYKYRGRGFIQHTGKNQYAAISRFAGVDLLSNPDALNEPSIAAKAIAWFFLQYKKLKPSDLESISSVNRAVGFADTTGEKAEERTASATQIYATIEPQTASTGTQVASASAEVVGARREQEAQRRVATNTTLVATRQTTAIQPRPAA
jgi:putative chitinase